MTLAEWLATPDEHGLRRRKRDFAARIGVTPTMVTEYAKGAMWPGREKIEAIVRETAGQVTANDFLAAEAQRTIADRQDELQSAGAAQ